MIGVVPAGRSNAGKSTLFCMAIIMAGLLTLSFSAMAVASDAYAATAPSASISSVKAGSGKFAVSVKSKKADGYQVRYSPSKTFKKAKTKSFSSKKTTVKSLKGYKKYYVKVRSYSKVGSKKIYSKWSSAKTVRTKRTLSVSTPGFKVTFPSSWKGKWSGKAVLEAYSSGGDIGYADYYVYVSGKKKAHIQVHRAVFTATEGAHTTIGSTSGGYRKVVLYKEGLSDSEYGYLKEHIKIKSGRFSAIEGWTKTYKF